MARFFRIASLLTLAAALASWSMGCGLVYQAGTRFKAGRMTENLKVGESVVDVHNEYGEPDIRQYPNATTEIWSYPYKPNSNDVIAFLFFTSAKEGDAGTFVDLKFVDAKLVSWNEEEHTMPPKERSGFGAGLGSPRIAAPGGSHY